MSLRRWRVLEVRFRKLRRLQRGLSRLLNRQSHQQSGFPGKVIKIVDGDTTDVLTNDEVTATRIELNEQQ